LFLLFNPWKTKKLKQILEPFSVSVAILVALGWFLVMYFEHGSAYFSSFFADQVGDRVSSKSAQVVKNLFLGLVTLFAFLIPWVLMAVSKPKNLKETISNLRCKIKRFCICTALDCADHFDVGGSFQILRPLCTSGHSSGSISFGPNFY
jgi:uncharacterized membrane protein